MTCQAERRAGPLEGEHDERCTVGRDHGSRGAGHPRDHRRAGRMSPRTVVLDAPDGVLPTAVVDEAGLPAQCDECGDAYVYWRDPDGLWRECYCDAGYVLLV